jgi:hypothetical protein
LAEQPSCKRQVSGSIPDTGSQVRGVSTLGVSRFVERMLLAGLSGSAPTAVTDGGGGVDEAPKPLSARKAGQGRVRPANRAGARIADPRRARERFISRGGEALGGAQQPGLYPADRGRITRHQRGQIGKRHTRSFTSAAYLCPEEAAVEQPLGELGVDAPVVAGGPGRSWLPPGAIRAFSLS